jgi:DNA-binding transcriptional ArsR family regulator
MVKQSTRTLTDPRTLRAMSHPVRLALLEALLSGPLTATEAGELIGETPTTCSFHLRQLAKYGFVEEVGGGKGRARPWRRVDTGWDAPAQPDNPEFTRASQALDEVLLDRYVERLRRVVRTAPSYPRDWYEAMTGSQNILHLTADELREVVAAYKALSDEFRDRWGDRTQQPQTRPEGALAVETLFFAAPIDLPEKTEREVKPKGKRS